MMVEWVNVACSASCNQQASCGGTTDASKKCQWHVQVYMPWRPTVHCALYTVHAMAANCAAKLAAKLALRHPPPVDASGSLAMILRQAICQMRSGSLAEAWQAGRQWESEP
jgi:hypothetical protein